MIEKYNCRLKSCLIVLILLLLLCACSADDGQETRFRDDFEDSRSGWGTQESAEFNRGYTEGEYFIELDEPNWFAWAYPGVQFDDASVEVNAYLSSGSQDGHFGVLCRYKDEDNFYYFAISADGYYAIFRRENGDVLKVITGDGEGMTHSTTIRTGGQINNIQAVCQGDELSLYVNGKLLETVSDDTHVQGDVGLGAGSGPEGDVHIRFDDLNVDRP